MKYYFKEQSNVDYKFAKMIKKRICNEIDQIYAGIVLGNRNLKPKSDPNCKLQGYWGTDCHSMSS